MDDYKELLHRLVDAGVRFLVVGGYAAIAHGLTRATDDLDIWIDPTLDNAKKATSALEQFGTPVDRLSLDLVADPDSFFRIGEDRGRKVDIMGHPGGDLSFRKAWSDRYETEFVGMLVPFVGLRDLLTIKQAVGRHRDLADVESLRAFHRLPDD